MKEKIGLIGGILSATIIIAFALYLVVNDSQQNIASWCMWTILNTLTVATCYAAGNKRPWLPIGWTVGAFLVTFIVFSKGAWRWGFVETMAAAGVVVAMLCWWKLGAKSAVIMTTIASLIAAIPAMIDAWNHPAPESWWLWGGVASCCILSCYGAKAWTVEERLPACSSFIFNTLMTILVLRGKW